MRTFSCERCGTAALFGADRCPTCNTELGYVSEFRTIRALTPTNAEAVYHVDGLADPVWRCLNAAWGCNWVVPMQTDTTWCRSCRLTRGRPADSRTDALPAWVEAEAAKRRLVHQLAELALPVTVRSDASPDGLAFDLVHLPGMGGVTGHHRGVVTFDLVETDERHREELRRRLGERFRTVIGHLRHEIGHYFFAYLVAHTNRIDEFRQLFGDDRDDYAGAIDRHYAFAGHEWDRTRFVTAYAGSHPLEDWAETFAHYLHVVDAIDTATAHRLVIAEHPSGMTMTDVAAHTLDDILDAWRPINTAVNAIADSLGAPQPYPFDPAGIVVDKLAFVHRQVGAHAGRSNLYAS